MTREAKAAIGMPVGVNGDEGFYAEVSKTFGATGIKIGSIKVALDGHGPTGYYDRVTVWSTKASLLWEGPLHGLEGVIYECRS